VLTLKPARGFPRSARIQLVARVDYTRACDTGGPSLRLRGSQFGHHPPFHVASQLPQTRRSRDAGRLAICSRRAKLNPRGRSGSSNGCHCCAAGELIAAAAFSTPIAEHSGPSGFLATPPKAYRHGSPGLRRRVSDGSSPKQSLYARENSPKCQKPQLSASAETVVDPWVAARSAWRTRCSLSRIK